MKRIFYKYNRIILSFLLLLIFPYMIDRIIMNKIITNWDLHDWAGFLGAYIGAFIALFGVWWQVRRGEIQKEKDEKLTLLKSIKYQLELNLSSQNEIEQFPIYIYEVLSYNINFDLYKRKNKFFLLNSPIAPFSIVLFKISFYLKILKIEEKMKKVNEAYEKLADNMVLKYRILNKIISKDRENKSILLELKNRMEMFRIIEISRNYNKREYIKKSLDKIKEIIKRKENNPFIVLMYSDKILTNDELKQIREIHNYERDLIEIDIFSLIDDLKNLYIDIQKEINKLEK